MLHRHGRVEGLVIILLSAVVLCPRSSSAQSLDNRLKPIVEQVVAGCTSAGLKRVTVADFSDLQGDVTELGRFVAEEVSSGIVMARPTFAIVDRGNLQKLLAEHKLNASGLVNPETAKKMGQIAGVDGIVIGTITPMGRSIRVTVKVLSTESALVVAAARGDIDRNAEIDSLLERAVEEPSDPGGSKRAPSLPDKLTLRANRGHSWSIAIEPSSLPRLEAGTPVTAVSGRSGIVDSDGDQEDVFVFQASRNEELSLSLAVLQRKSPNTVFALNVFDATGQLLREALDAGSNAVATSFKASQSGYFYVAVAGVVPRAATGGSPLESLMAGNMALIYANRTSGYQLSLSRK